ncbi:MAG: hypothetical protein IMF13_07085 [Proteobacteria bacterium]|nr:hypothetical protein [Pseudomonadota bacterium]
MFLLSFSVHNGVWVRRSDEEGREWLSRFFGAWFFYFASVSLGNEGLSGLV